MVSEIIRLPGVDVNARTRGGETPLMHAAQSGNIYVVGECLNNRFNPFFKNSLGQTVLDFASQFKNVYG